MKKNHLNTSKRKLALNKNTIKFLSGTQLEDVAGGKCKFMTCNNTNANESDTCGC